MKERTIEASPTNSMRQSSVIGGKSKIQTNAVEPKGL
jgi:hypothetical protein